MRHIIIIILSVLGIVGEIFLFTKDKNKSAKKWAIVITFCMAEAIVILLSIWSLIIGN
jgi:F0F1-type ATP synthase assembly protein I